MLYSDRSSAPGDHGSLRGAVPLEVPGRRWSLQFTPTLEYAVALRNWRAWAVLAGWLLWTSLLGAFLLVVTGRAAVIERLVHERTAQLVAEVKERQLAEAAVRAREEQLRARAQSASDGIIAAAGAGTIISWNKGAEPMLGYTEQEVLGQPLTLLMPERYHGAHSAGIERLRSGAPPKLFGRTIELQAQGTDGTEVPVALTLASWKTAEGLFYSAILRDISERKKSEEEAVLLKEIHHRVKNNLQIVSSVLSLQEGTLRDAQALAAMRESRTRLRAMALIHELLQQSASLTRINFAEYLQKLAAYLVVAYLPDPGRVRIACETGLVTLSLDVAIPCGLIAHALVTNALQHAFPNGRSGDITLVLQSGADETFLLTVADMGVGMPQSLDRHPPSSPGLKLVHALATQLRGALRLERRDGGTVWTLEFRDRSAGGGEGDAATGYSRGRR